MADNYFEKHKDVFLNEAKAHIDRMNSSLLGFEKNPADDKLFHELFRSTHTLKGIAATMNYVEMSQLCHAVEDVLEALRGKRIGLANVADRLFESFDFMSSDLKAITGDDQEINAAQMIDRLDRLLKSEEWKEEEESGVLAQHLQKPEKLKSIEVNIERLDGLMKISEELLISRIKLELLREAINNPELTAAVDTLGRHITNMQYNIMQVRLVPIGFIFNRFPRMVRDLAKRQNKQVDLEIEGGAIELDRSLIDDLGESLMHLIRNAIDHGIEDPEERVKHGKNKTATIRLIAKRTKEHALIEVSDDGEGLDLEAIQNMAIKQKLISSGASRQEILNCIFRGISTTKDVSDISGRGMGLSIVKQQIDSIGGNIQVESEEGRGTRFRLTIPLTLAVINVLFVNVGEQIYAIPINQIDRLLTVTDEEIKGMIDYNAIPYGDSSIPLTHLAELFLLPTERLSSYPIVVVRRGEERLGLLVDRLLSTQEVVIKPLTRIVRESKYFSGSALIGSGDMVLILDVDHLFLTGRFKNEWGYTNAV